MSFNINIWGNCFMDNSSIFGDSSLRHEESSKEDCTKIEKILKVPANGDILSVSTELADICIMSANCKNMEVYVYGKCSSNQIELVWDKETRELKLKDKLPDIIGSLYLKVMIPNRLTYKYLCVNTKFGNIKLSRNLKVENVCAISQNGNIEFKVDLQNDLEATLGTKNGCIAMLPTNVGELEKNITGAGTVIQSKFVLEKDGYSLKTFIINEMGTTKIRVN